MVKCEMRDLNSSSSWLIQGSGTIDEMILTCRMDDRAQKFETDVSSVIEISVYLWQGQRKLFRILKEDVTIIK